MHTIQAVIPFLRRNAFALMTVALFTGLFFVAILQLMYEAKVFVDQQIAQDIEQLSKIFTKIDADCRIVTFAQQKNAIDFLNVKKFAGTTVGSMQLMFPDRWKGPYLTESLSVFGKPYMIVRTKTGFFIAPPEGTRLGNGKLVGTDILLDETANVSALMQDARGLKSADKALAAKLYTTGVRGPMLQTILPEEE